MIDAYITTFDNPKELSEKFDAGVGASGAGIDRCHRH
jgi:hypothetical protein